jgi:hypothetical protein
MAERSRSESNTSTASAKGVINDDKNVQNLLKETALGRNPTMPLSIAQRRKFGRNIANGTAFRVGGKTRRHSKKRKQHRKTSHRRK